MSFFRTITAICILFIALSSCTSVDERRDAFVLHRTERIVRAMTDSELVGQIFMISLRRDLDGKIVDSSVKEMGPVTASLINEIKPGGILLYGENISTINETIALNRNMQNLSNYPLWIAIDEEGGVVSRLDSSESIANTSFKSNLEIAEIGDSQLAFSKGRIIGKELLGLGINMNFSPIADINTNPDNPIIGARAYGADPEIAAHMVSAESRGLQSENVAAVLKHFPGHGDTVRDSHDGAVSVSHDLERLKTVEFKPFAAGIDSGVVGIMVGHIGVPEVTGNNLPATFSSMLLTGILRGDLGFSGLIISDSMGMGAITIDQQQKNAIVEGFKAGIDILLNPPHPLEARDALLEALRSGEISREQVEQSVMRILIAKQQMGLWDTALDPEEDYPEDYIGSERHQKMAESIVANNS